MKTFKDKQKVTHPKYGEGVFNLHHPTNKYSIDFGDIQTLWKDVNDEFYNKLEAVEDLPEVGEYAYFWNEGYKHALYAKFQKKANDRDIYKYRSMDTLWRYISKTPPKFD